MPLYEYKCGGCGQPQYRSAPDPPDPPVCPYCQIPTKRVFGFSYVPGFEGHWNPGTNSHVRSLQHHQGELDRASDAAEADTGIPHKYTTVDLRDPERNGVVGQGGTDGL